MIVAQNHSWLFDTPQICIGIFFIQYSRSRKYNIDIKNDNNNLCIEPNNHNKMKNYFL